MALKCLALEIMATHFQKFYSEGLIIQERVPVENDLKVGDTVTWECAQLFGFARVVSRVTEGGDIYCGLKRV